MLVFPRKKEIEQVRSKMFLEYVLRPRAPSAYAYTVETSTENILQLEEHNLGLKRLTNY